MKEEIKKNLATDTDTDTEKWSREDVKDIAKCVLKYFAYGVAISVVYTYAVIEISSHIMYKWYPEKANENVRNYGKVFIKTAESNPQSYKEYKKLLKEAMQMYK